MEVDTEVVEQKAGEQSSENTGPVRRKRRLDDGESPPRKRAKKQKKKKSKSSKQSCRPLETINIQEYECTVCSELPSDMFQCFRGHIMCSGCYKRVADGKRPECPVCRVKLDRRNPIRNMLGEKNLATVLMDCRNSDCEQKIQFKYLNEHEQSECEFRQVSCKYAPLGCEWLGYSRDHKAHKKTCEIKSMTAKRLLPKVVAKEAQREEVDKKSKETNAHMASALGMLESRARNIVIRDVILDGGQDSSEVIKSHRFHALHTSWRANLKVIEINGANRVQFQLENVSIIIRNRMHLNIMVLKGPDFGYAMEPSYFEVDISKRKQVSEWVNLRISPERASAVLSSQDQINLRIVFVDKRCGRSSASFRAEHHGSDTPSTYYTSDADDLSTGSSGDDDSDDDDDGREFLDFGSSEDEFVRSSEDEFDD